MSESIVLDRLALLEPDWTDVERRSRDRLLSQRERELLPFERLHELRSDDAVRPWLAQLTRRLCIDRLRLIARDTPSDSEPDEREVDDVLATLDDAMSVRAALDKVGDPCREILDRFFCRDESYRKIGETLDIAAGTIASRISRCLEKVRAELDGRSRASRPS